MHRYYVCITGDMDVPLVPITESPPWVSIYAVDTRDAAVCVCQDSTRPAGVHIPWTDDGNFWVHVVPDNPDLLRDNGIPMLSHDYRFSRGADCVGD